MREYSPTLTLDDKEVDCSRCQEQTPGKDISVSEVDISDDEWCEESEEEIPEPIGGSRHSHRH